jgi:very-short-patch-repair endonuclease
MPDRVIIKAQQFRIEARWAEKLLWHHLHNYKMAGYKFRRQQPFGQYVLDFYCPEKRLGIEVDGREHGDPESIRHDQIRDDYLRAQGVRILRFWNFQLRENLEGVLLRIRMELDTSKGSPSPCPPPRRGEGKINRQEQ